jgi:hypothetical protein
MKPSEKNQKTFTKVNDSLRRISVQEINSTQKIFFAYIIGWQEKGKTLTAKNKYIADQLGLTESGIRKVISTSKKFDFFSSKQLGNKKGENGYTSTHEIKIDIDKFNEYLKSKSSKTAFYENLNEPENEPDEVEEPNQPEEETTVDNKASKEILIDDSNQSDNDLLKEKLREKYNFFFKNSNEDTTLISTKYHILTNNYFKDKLKADELNNLIQIYNRNNFELFWNEINQLKEELRASGRLKN